MHIIHVLPLVIIGIAVAFQFKRYTEREACRLDDNCYRDKLRRFYWDNHFSNGSTFVYSTANGDEIIYLAIGKGSKKAYFEIKPIPGYPVYRMEGGKYELTAILHSEETKKDYRANIKLELVGRNLTSLTLDSNVLRINTEHEDLVWIDEECYKKWMKN